MDLIPYIYHERQEPGSMLCAQHALNNLMQNPLWTADNLAEIAQRLDLLEASHLDTETPASRRSRSSNYDDSGFFSVQVIDDALHQLGLRLIRWRSEEMKPLHDYPENQDAFILNHDLHWFTLRRFGKNADRWYNLNSMADQTPTWIGPSFLSMAISQAEAEGYSIFAVVPVEPSPDPSAPQPGNLMACEADDQAVLLDQLSYSPLVGSNSSSGSSAVQRRPREEVEDEDEGTVPRTRMRMSEEGEVDPTAGMSYDDQLRLAIEASLISDTPRADTGKGRQRPDEVANDDASAPNGTFSRAPPTTSKSSNALAANCHKIEDAELAAAISASLADHNSNSIHSNDNVSNADNPTSLNEVIDEPTPDELRQRRLARFA